MSAGKDEPASCRDRNESFATTHWSVVLAAGEAGSAGSGEALERLCRSYWYPLYAFVRRKGYGVPEAEDLTQEFFARLLSRSFPNGIRPEGGKFRSYLLTALQHFLVNEWNHARTRKRGGGRPPLSLDAFQAEDRYRSEPADDATPEVLFDRQWAAVLLKRVADQLSEECSAAGKAAWFEALRSCLTGAERCQPYAELARQMGCTESAVKMAVHRLRKRYGELLRREISHTVASPIGVEEEIRALLAAVR